MRELEQLLPIIEPPPGGLARLQGRIASRGQFRHASHVNRWAWAATACTALVVAVVAIQPRVAQQQRTKALETALRQDISADSAGGIRVVNGAAIELPSGQANVRLYLVQSVPRAGGGK